jgi:hypothetical protein
VAWRGVSRGQTPCPACRANAVPAVACAPTTLDGVTVVTLGQSRSPACVVRCGGRRVVAAAGDVY